MTNKYKKEIIKKWKKEMKIINKEFDEMFDEYSCPNYLQCSKSIRRFYNKKMKGLFKLDDK